MPLLPKSCRGIFTSMDNQRALLTDKTKVIQMAIIKIDNKEYEYDNLSDEAKVQLQNLQFVDNELGRLQAQSAVFQTARIAYAKALTERLDPVVSDASKMQ